MSLVRWDPFAEMDSFFDRPTLRLLRARPRLRRGEEAQFEWSPSADISETEKEYLIRAELPAVKKEDVKVTAHENMITIQGERKLQKQDKDEKYSQIESFHGTFTRRFALPSDADVANIRCEDRDGVLTIHIPKSPSTKSKPIEIKVE